MTDKPFTFADLPADSFPLTIDVWRREADRRGAPSWSTTVEGPGALTVPGFGPGTWVRVSYGDGSVVMLPPLNAV